MAKSKDNKRSGSRRRHSAKADTVGETLVSWKDFLPGIVCGGKLEPSVVESRMEDCTEHHLKQLKASSAFKAWERGEDLHAGKSVLDSFVSYTGERWETCCEYLKSIDPATMKKWLLVVVIIVLAVVAGVVQKQPVRSTEVGYDAASEALLEKIREERRTENVTDFVDQRIDSEVPGELVQNDVPIEETTSHLFEHEIQQLNQKISDLELQVELEKKRATLAKEKEDKMFGALEASTHKVHRLSKQVKDSESQIKALETNVRISVKHSAMLESFNMALLILESILVCSSMVAYVKSHRIRSAFLKARNSFMVAWRRQQRVLAVADDVYNDALRYKSEVEASDVGPRVSDILNPWDPIISDLDALIKAHVGVERGATPVQAMAALQQYFVDKKAQERDFIAEKEARTSSQATIETLEERIKELTEEHNASATVKQHTEQNLEAEIKSLQDKAVVADNELGSIKKELESLLHEKRNLSEQLVKSSEELERVTAYATSLEEASLVLEQKLKEANDVKTHLDEFEKTMNAATKVPGLSEEDDEEELKENNMGHINESVLGERIRKIRQLIQDANASPFELLSPNADLYDGEDVETALKTLPVIGPMHISSSDSDDDFTQRQDESLHRMLTASEALSSQVGEYISILEGMYSHESNEHAILDLKEKKSTVDGLRSTLESLISASEKELRACRALKAKRRQIDFLSEKEEQEHGEKELKAADALFYAREKEKDACIELETAQSALRAAMQHARGLVRDT